jgi:uncharacterized protein (TIGR03000 family)
MSRIKLFTLTALAAAAFLWAAAPATARPWGHGGHWGYGGWGGYRGYGGWGYGGWGHRGWGGYWGGYYPRYYGWGGYYPRYYGYGGYYGGYYPGSYGYAGLGYGGYYPGYVTNSSGGYYPGYTYASGPVYSGNIVAAAGPPATVNGTRQASYYTPAADNKAHLHVHVPAGARVWVGGAATTQTGTERDFVSPELNPGKTYSYEVKARWTQDGQPVEETRTVKVRANETSNVRFGSQS